MNVKIMKVRMLCAMVTLLCACSVFGAKTFTNVSGTDWNTPENWGGTLPIQGDDVIIDGNVVLTNSTPALNSYTLNVNRWHTFDGWDTTLSAVTVGIYGTMTHTNNLATNAVDDVWIPNARVNISCTDLTVSVGGKINADGKGFRGGFLPNTDGYGPGRGSYAAKSGGGYGSKGGRAAGIYGQMYGDPYAPVDPGSGGNSGIAPRVGGNGGGAIRIAATGIVTVNGSISASGAGRSAWYEASAGSGGSVYITCNVLAGTGMVSANAEISGNGTGGGGGSGRIAVIYNPASQSNAVPPTITFTLNGGQETTQWTQPGGSVGTLYFPDNQILERGPDLIKHSGVWVHPMTRFDRNNLMLDGAWLVFPASGFELNVTNSLTVKGTDILKHKLEIPDGNVLCGNMLLNKSTFNIGGSLSGVSKIDVGGNMMVSNSSVVRLYCGVDASPDTPSALVEVANELTVAAASWIYTHSHPTNGASPLFKLGRLNIAAAGAGIYATGLGFAGGTNAPGFGPGHGSQANGGAGYGGLGGLHTDVYGLTNGFAIAPVLPGSGGGSGSEAPRQGPGGMGGGLVRIITGDATVNGSILANGLKGGNGSSGGGGSGGGIFIICNSFSGTGSLSANGGEDAPYGSTGSGGGGRIAIWLSVPETLWPRYLTGDAGGAKIEQSTATFTGTVTANKGALAGSTGTLGTDGTIVFLTPPPLGSTIILK